MSSLARVRELHEAFNFRVALDLDNSINFQSCSAIEVAITTTVYKEAGATLPVKAPDFVDYPDITLTRGVSKSRTLYAWFNECLTELNGLRLGQPISRNRIQNLRLYQYNRAKEIVKRYTLFGAFPVHFVAGNWDNATDAVVIEALTLTYDFFTIDVR